MIDSSWPKRIASKLAIPLLTKHEPKQVQEIVDSSLEFNVVLQHKFEKTDSPTILPTTASYCVAMA